MKIAYIASGAGGMYCGTCLHDNTLAAALLRMGHKVALIPTYTPLRTDEESVSAPDIFYGGVNVFLQQKFALFRRAPAAVDRWLNHPSLLNLVSRFSSSTNAKDLGPLTISVLRGEEGLQKKELQKLVAWLKEDYRPELIHLTNSMFSGFAKELKREVRVPVLCSVQGEDLFLEELVEPHKTRALQVLRERARDVDGFLAPCRYYADFMSEYLKIPAQKFHVVRLGIHWKGHGEPHEELPGEPFVIGYLARICPEKGLHLLVDAFLRLSQNGHDVRLKIAGYLAKKDQPYWERLESRIANAGIQDRLEFCGEVDRTGKIRFLNEIHVLSVPTVYREPKGLYVLEALANGVPVVVPKHGAFPEWIEATEGGILVEPQSGPAVAEGILSLKGNPELRKRMGRRGQQAVRELFNDEVMAKNALDVFQQYVRS